MHLSVAKLGGEENVLTVEISSDLSLKDFKAVIEAESDFGITAEQMVLFYEGKILDDDHRTLAECRFHDYDLITCQRRTTHTNESRHASNRINPNDPRQLFEMFRSNPQMIEAVQRNSPQTAEAIRSGNFNRFVELISNQSPAMREQREMNELASLDPFDPDVQRRIHDMITMQNVQENMEHAVEHAPEVFGHVIMLYINCKVNGHDVKAFVDSGAQMTIMSQNCAERCGIMRLVDRRFSGIAKGVGTQRILGRIHLAQLEIEKHYFATSLSVLEDQPMDMLLGLDMLKRHQCVIDLQENVLRFGNTVQTRFLPESELPMHARLSSDPDPNQPTTSSNSSEDNRQRATTTASSSSSSPFPDETIREITKNGFTREQAIDELKLVNGDSKKALISLMAKSLSMPKRKR